MKSHTSIVDFGSAKTGRRRAKMSSLLEPA